MSKIYDFSQFKAIVPDTGKVDFKARAVSFDKAVDDSLVRQILASEFHMEYLKPAIVAKLRSGDDRLIEQALFSVFGFERSMTILMEQSQAKPVKPIKPIRRQYLGLFDEVCAIREPDRDSIVSRVEAKALMQIMISQALLTQIDLEMHAAVVDKTSRLRTPELEREVSYLMARAIQVWDDAEALAKVCERLRTVLRKHHNPPAPAPRNPTNVVSINRRPKPKPNDGQKAKGKPTGKRQRGKAS